MEAPLKWYFSFLPDDRMMMKIVIVGRGTCSLAWDPNCGRCMQKNLTPSALKALPLDLQVP
jgi:hypothetical protein